MVVLLILMTNAVVFAAAYGMGRTDELLDRSFWSFLRSRDDD